MILKIYLRRTLINNSAFTKCTEHKIKKVSLFIAADSNLQNKVYSCNIKDYDISLTLIGALVCMMVVVGMFVPLI